MNPTFLHHLFAYADMAVLPGGEVFPFRRRKRDEPAPAPELFGRLPVCAFGMPLITVGCLGVLVFGNSVCTSIHRIIIVPFFGCALCHTAGADRRAALNEPVPAA